MAEKLTAAVSLTLVESVVCGRAELLVELELLLEQLVLVFLEPRRRFL